MPSKAPPGTGRALVASVRTRTAIIRRLTAVTGKMTSAVVAAMEANHPWFRELGAEERSWITIVARAGIDGFVRWFADDTDVGVDPSDIFNVAPRAMTRKISLHQTVDLVRTTIEVVEEQIQHLSPRSDRAPLQTAIVHYSREVAFAAAHVYARAAESRGSWDEHVETLVVDAIVRADPDETLLSRASTLGWPANAAVFVAVGAHATGAAAGDLSDLRRAAEESDFSLLSSVQGNRLVVVVTGIGLDDPDRPVRIIEALVDYFGPGPVVVGPVVDDLIHASSSARAAMSGVRAASAWKEGPQVVSARDLLPERTLAGNGHARRELVETVYRPLADAGGDLMQTCVSFLDNGCSVEATARGIFVHANTVRYRLKRILDVTGYSPADPRDAYVLRLALTLGRLQGSLTD